MPPPMPAPMLCSAIFMCCWITAFLGVMMAAGSLSFKNFRDYDANGRIGVNQLSNMYAMGRDW